MSALTILQEMEENIDFLFSLRDTLSRENIELKMKLRDAEKIIEELKKENAVLREQQEKENINLNAKDIIPQEEKKTKRGRPRKNPVAA